MTKLEELWQGHQPATGGLPDIVNLNTLKPVEGLSVLKKLRRMLRINLGFELAVVVAYVTIMTVYPSWQLLVLFGIALLLTLWGAWATYKLYRGIDTPVRSTSLLTELQRNRDALRAWTHLQMSIAIFVYPFCVAGGFLWGGVMSSGGGLDAFIDKPAVLYALPITVIVLMPLSYWAAKRLFSSTFGRLTGRLNTHIEHINQIN